MSCYYKTLPWLIPQLLLLAPPKSEVILVSPWIDNVTLYPPIVGYGEHCYNYSKIRLSQFLLLLVQDYQMRITLILREQDRRSHRVIAPLTALQSNKLTVREVEYLHAKILITDRFVIETSANLIFTSLYRNIESCTLLVNTHHNSRKYLKTRLNLTL